MTAPADPELLLAAACCRWPPSPARDAAVRAAASRVDWARFGKVVVRQRVAGLVEAGLKAAGVAVPDAVAIPLARLAKRIVHQNLVATGETARLIGLIAEAGYPVLAVKGVVLGALAYRSIALKHSKDIDLLILPEHVEPVLALLEADAYRITLPAETLSPAQRRMLTRYGKDVGLVRGTHHVQVELHWRLFASAQMLPGITATSPAQTVALGSGLAVPTLAAPDLYAYLVLHGGIDGWSRLKWLADVNALIATHGPHDLHAWHAHAAACGAGPASEQALTMMADLFTLPLPADLAATIGRTPRVRMLVAGAYRLMAVADGATEIADWRRGQKLALAMHFLLGRGARFHWHIVKSVLYMQGDMYRSKLPPRLYVLYPLVRVPLWVGRRIGRSVDGLFGRGKSATVPAKSR